MSNMEEIKEKKRKEKIQVRGILPKCLLMCAIMYEKDEEKSGCYECFRL